MKKLIINHQASKEIISFFEVRGYDIHSFYGSKAYEAVRHHPDLYLFYDGDLFVEPSVNMDGIKCSEIGFEYPDHVKYNVAKVGQHFICNPQYLDETLFQYLDDQYTLIAVKQGYAKCSTLVVDETSIITSDKGIYKAVLDQGLDALLIRPGYISLPGLSYGFIGGSGVRFENEVFFCGDISKHPDFDKIENFITSKALKISFAQGPLMDLGSLFFVESVRK